MGRIGWRWADDASFAAEQSVNLLDSVAETVKEDNIISGDLGFATAIGHVGQKLTGLKNTLGGTVAITAVGHSQVGDDLLHPFRDLFALRDRITNVLYIDLDPERFKLVGNLYDGSDFIGQFPGPDVDDVVTHVGLLSRHYNAVDIKKAMEVNAMALCVLCSVLVRSSSVGR